MGPNQESRRRDSESRRRDFEIPYMGLLLNTVFGRNDPQNVFSKMVKYSFFDSRITFASVIFSVVQCIW